MPIDSWIENDERKARVRIRGDFRTPDFLEGIDRILSSERRGIGVPWTPTQAAADVPENP